MTLDCDDYRINVNDIKKLTERLTQVEREEFIGRLAVITGVPIIIVCCYIGELYGFTDSLNAFIIRLKEFYVIEEVLNVK